MQMILYIMQMKLYVILSFPRWPNLVPGIFVVVVVVLFYFVGDFIKYVLCETVSQWLYTKMNPMPYHNHILTEDWFFLILAAISALLYVISSSIENVWHTCAHVFLKTPYTMLLQHFATPTVYMQMQQLIAMHISDKTQASS